MPNPFDVAVPNVAQGLLGFQRARKLRQDAATSRQNREISLERLGLLKSSQAQSQENTESNQAFRQSQAKRSQANADRTFNESQRQFGVSSGLKAGALRAKSASLKNLTPGQKKTDQVFAKEFVGFTASGGFADVEKQLVQLEDVLKQLEDPKGVNLTGPLIGQMGGAIASTFAPAATAAREAVEEVVQRNLRIILGAQFTQKEGERLIARAFNPRLEEPENAKRVKRLIKQIRTAGEQKQAASDYFEANGTLVGFKGKTPSLGDFDDDDDDDDDDGSPKFEGGPGLSGGDDFTEIDGFKIRRIK